jgi:hypothetical protein
MSDYFNSVVSFNLRAIVYGKDSTNNVFIRVVNKQDQDIVLDWTLLTDIDSPTVSALSLTTNITRFLAAYNIPIEPAEAYTLELKLRNELWLESDVFNQVVTADLTRPVFNNSDLLVSQPEDLVHSVIWGDVLEDVSEVERIEVWSRIGEDPRWSIVHTSSSPSSNQTRISGLKPYTSYYYKAIAYNSAGLASDPLLKQGSIQTSKPVDTLTKLSNYPNPFNSNLKDTTIVYFLNQDMDITIKIYNIYGKKVYEKNCFSSENGGSEGNNEIIWDGTDQAGNRLPMGSYPMVIYDGKTKAILDQRVIGVIH